MNTLATPGSGGLISDDVRRFFTEFERTSNELDPAASAGQFADNFLSADPNRVVVVPKAAFLAALPQRIRLFESMGRTGTRLVSIHETALDERHVLVDTQWTAHLVDPAGRSDNLPLSSVFILRRENAGLRIVFYLNRQDIASVIQARQRGCLQAGEPTDEAAHGSTPREHP